MARPTKKELERREAAKKRVEELLGDIVIDDKDVADVADKLDKLQEETSKSSGSGKNTAWLEKEMERLSEKNKELEDQLIKGKEDFNKLLNSRTAQASSEPVDVSKVESGVRKIFNELRNNFEGNNSSRTKYTQANIKPLLEKFLQTFEFLRKK